MTWGCCEQNLLLFYYQRANRLRNPAGTLILSSLLGYRIQSAIERTARTSFTLGTHTGTISGGCEKSASMSGSSLPVPALLFFALPFFFEHVEDQCVGQQNHLEPFPDRPMACAITSVQTKKRTKHATTTRGGGGEERRMCRTH